jgi:DNA-binding transcriptional ArsR family regulator
MDVASQQVSGPAESGTGPEARIGDDGPGQGGETDEWDRRRGPTRDQLFHVLRNQRRRFAIQHLKRASEPVDVGDLATQIAAWENGTRVEAVTSKQRRRVYNALQQTHVPELEDTGIVEVDRREVELTDRAGELDIYLEVVPGEDIPWSEYYLALGGIGVAVVAVVWLNVGPFGLVPDIAAGAFLVTTLLLSAAANYYYQHENLLGGAEKPPELRGG